MNILDALKQLRDDIKIWVTNNLNALNAKIDEKTIPIDKELSVTSTNPVQNKTITTAINNIPIFSGSYNDLTDAPNITEDDSGNMVIVDESGNIIFKTDADGIHTTAVSLNGETAASEKYVDEAIANIPKVDFAGYATEDYVTSAVSSVKDELSESIVAEAEDWKVVDGSGNIIFIVDNTGAHTTSLTLNGEEAATKTYVDEAIGDIEFPETDLTGYATENYVDNAIASIPQTDLTGYATEKYVDDAIDAIPETDLSGYYTKEQTDTAINTAKEEISESIVAESDEWKVVDESGNIIFSVDASGAHTTTLTLNGESVEDIVDERVASLVDSAPDTLNTLNELAAALGDDPNFATTVATEIGKKIDKETGKGLSANDFTDEYKNILDNLGSMAFEETDPTVPDWAKSETKPEYTADEVGALSNTTKLADLPDDINHRTVSDNEKSIWNSKSDFSGDYSDLKNAPNITEDNDNNLIVSDDNGNIIFRSDMNGLETTNLTAQSVILNGADLNDTLGSKQNKITGSAGQFVVIGSDGDVTTKTIPYAEDATF